MSRISSTNVTSVVLASIAAMTSITSIGAIARAQPAEATPPPAAPPLPPPPPAPGPAAPAATATAPAATTDVAAGKEETDHSKVVGHVGVGYFGQFDLPLGYSPPGPPATLATHIIGIRYWFQEKLGLDLGLGWAMTSGSDTNAGVSTDRASTIGISFKGGLPISMYDGKHYSFIFEPQALFGHAGQTQKAAPAAGRADTTLSGNRFMAGMTAGAILHFGFIGVPQLTLDANVGLFMDLQGGSTKSPAPGAPTTTVEQSYTTFGLSTSTGHQPWNIFTSNVAAIYHF